MNYNTTSIKELQTGTDQLFNRGLPPDSISMSNKFKKAQAVAPMSIHTKYNVQVLL